ncbi:MAG: hypothetical protein J6O49_15105 [Bacteroidaceae bacterium]|nr:hypothetical protein [Bacteroidaceae bacterium]
MEYVNKRWDLPTMEVRMENLKKIINPHIVETSIAYYENIADNRLDALYLAYYQLKDDYCKIKRRTFGKPKNVEYKPKKSTSWWYKNDDDSNTTWWSPSNYTWTITTSYSSSATTYSYNSYYNQL